MRKTASWPTTTSERPVRPLSPRETALQRLFEDLHATYHRPVFLPGDPLLFAHRYSEPRDAEVAALTAAAFASGNITSIQRFLEGFLGVLGPRPADWLAERQPGELCGAFGSLGHRWVRPADLEVFAALLGGTLRRHGSLGALWRECDARPAEEPTVLPVLGRFVEAILSERVAPLAPRTRERPRPDGTMSVLPPAVSILLTHPAGGSACKRMNLFLRWMVRPADGIDLGLWTAHTDPARLVLPVDVHVLRICRKLRLTRRPQPDLKTAEGLTARFRRLSPSDPCRYDFAMVRAGVDRIALNPPRGTASA